jgi:hypothetical protein
MAVVVAAVGALVVVCCRCGWLLFMQPLVVVFA